MTDRELLELAAKAADDIIRMARESKVIPVVMGNPGVYFAYLERFAALVAAAEREACAEVCDARARGWLTSVFNDLEDMIAEDYLLAAAIRARSQPATDAKSLTDAA
jgi:hypothetical protein